MKRITILIMMMLIVFSACRDKPEVIAPCEEFTGTLTLGIQGGDSPSTVTKEGVSIPEKERNTDLMKYRDVILADFPYKVEIRNYAADATTIKMDVDIAGGDAPDVYWDYLGRVNKYANSKYALPINLTFEELDDYLPSALAPVMKDGELYALPGTFWIAVMIVNKPLVESVGMGGLLEDISWTIDEFLMVVTAVQEKYGPEYYGYPLFASGTGGDYWSSFGWLSAFGAKLYDNGKIVINSKEGIEALEFMKFMSDAGLVAPGVAGLDYKIDLNAMENGNFVACGNTPAYCENFVKPLNGSEPWNAIMMEWPRAPGIDKVPVSVGPDAGMVFASTKHPVEAMELIRYLNSVEMQSFTSKTGTRFASRKSVGNVLANVPSWVIATEMVDKNGVFDTGVGLENYVEVRNLYPSMLQAIFSEEMTIQEAVDRFVKEGTAILERE